jgi:hypothetical protein
MRRTILLAILLAAAITGTAHAQDPCDVNPDDPSCDVELFTAAPATPDVCPAGGWVFIFMGTPYPVCNGLPGAPGAAVIVTKRGKRPWFRLYTAGPNGNMTGINLAMARR